MDEFISSNSYSNEKSMRMTSLSRTLTLKIVVLSLIALASIWGLLLMSLVSSIQRVHRDLERTKTLTIERLELFFTELEHNLSTEQISINKQEDYHLFLASILSKNPYISSICLMDERGNTLVRETAFGHVLPEDRSSAQATIIQDLARQDFSISPGYYIQGKSYVYGGVSLANDIDVSEKLLLATIDLTELWSQSIDINMSADTYVYLVDKNDHIITHPNQRYIGTRIKPKRQTRKSDRNDRDGSFFITRSVTDSWALALSSELHTVPWIVVVEQPLYSVLKPVFRTAIGLAPVILLVVFLLYDIIHSTRTHFILPLMALKKVVEASLETSLEASLENTEGLLSEPQQQQLIGRYGRDELIRFADIHLQLRETKESVEQLNAELEERVLERTAQLELEVRERQQAQEELLHLALHDPLTGLPNRIWLIERLSQELVRCKVEPGYQFALLFLDGDRFKLINDSLGHGMGDCLLVAVAKRLRNVLPSTCHVARLGGDEFTVLIETVHSVDQIEGIAQVLLDALTAPFQLAQHRLFFSVSVGISISDSSYDEPAQLLRDADIAMYEAKASGQGRYQLFDAVMRQKTIEQMQLEIDLQQAIARRQLYLNYQPIIDLKTGHLAGFEALVRWHHPVKGFVAPAQFVPIAEETGLIDKIDLWVLKQACQQMVKWQKQFLRRSLGPVTNKSLPFKMGVNLSAKQFAHRGLVNQIDGILAETGLSANQLKLEITETALLDSPDIARMLLAELRARRLQLAIDDFGIGYSSLSYLHLFPVQTLKIDQSFIRKLDSDASVEPIVRAMIDLAHTLDMEVIAEGIEEDNQYIRLKELGCDMGQGYLFAKPLSIRQATAFIQHQSSL